MEVTPDKQYPGGKGASGLAEWILQQLPLHEIFAEPFAGKATLTRVKSPALKTVLIEKSPEVCDWLRAECGYAVVCQGDGMSLLCGLAGPTCHESALKYPPLSSILFAEIGAVGLLHSRDDWSDQAVIYCDPPYLLSTRSHKDIYDHEWSDADHEQFLRVVQRVPCPVAISGYPSLLYRDRLTGWVETQTTAQTRGGLRTECLWRNRACMDALDRGSSRLAGPKHTMGRNW